MVSNGPGRVVGGDVTDMLEAALVRKGAGMNGRRWLPPRPVVTSIGDVWAKSGSCQSRNGCPRNARRTPRRFGAYAQCGPTGAPLVILSVPPTIGSRYPQLGLQANSLDGPSSGDPTASPRTVEARTACYPLGNGKRGITTVPPWSVRAAGAIGQHGLERAAKLTLGRPSVHQDITGSLRPHTTRWRGHADGFLADVGDISAVGRRAHVRQRRSSEHPAQATRRLGESGKSTRWTGTNFSSPKPDL